MLPITPFDVEVVNPAREEKDGGLKRGTIVTVRAFIAEHQVTGPYLIFFLVYNFSKNNFMLEPAYQFRPVDLK